MSKTTMDLADLVQRVTGRVIETLEQHQKLWTRTWHTSRPHSPATSTGLFAR